MVGATKGTEGLHHERRVKRMDGRKLWEGIGGDDGAWPVASIRAVDGAA